MFSQYLHCLPQEPTWIIRRSINIMLQFNNVRVFKLCLEDCIKRDVEKVELDLKCRIASVVRVRDICLAVWSQ